jgi:hypothetical protein
MQTPSAVKVRRCGHFLDIPVRKSEAARFLGVHRNTLTSWDKLARSLIDNYQTHFEQSGSLEQAPLSPYRFWVLTRLKELYRTYRNEFLVRSYVKAHPYDFSFRTFFELRKQERQAS